MFTADVLSETLTLHDKSYQLLKWVKDALRSGQVSFQVAHGRLSAPEAATEWLGRCYENLPVTVRPERRQIPRFAMLLTSYLQTSFTLRKDPPRVLVSGCGCYCSYCAILGRANELVVREPGSGAARHARELKRIALEKLAASLDCVLPPAGLDQILRERSLSRSLAIVAYVNELIRRCEFASQGDGVLVLWREFAWHNQESRRKPGQFHAVPIPKFQLKEEEVRKCFDELAGHVQQV